MTKTDDEDTTSVIAADQLRTIIERIEKLNEERVEISEQIKELYSEAKMNGFDTKTLRKIISFRKKDPNERSEEIALLDLYMTVLGMVA